MRLPQFQASTRRRMIVIVVAGVSLAALIGMVQFVMALRYWTFQHGYNSSVLPIGLKVVITQKVQIDGGFIEGGTQGVVVFDPPDDDSAYPKRLVGIKLTDGPNQGSTQAVQRRYLRVR